MYLNIYVIYYIKGTITSVFTDIQNIFNKYLIYTNQKIKSICVFKINSTKTINIYINNWKKLITQSINVIVNNEAKSKKMPY